jgi:RimJ/RimL family protein N-acetyltransferase
MTLAASTGPALVNTPVLETGRLILRAPDLRDFEAYAGFYASSRSGFVGGPMPRDKAWRFFGHHAGHWALRGYGTFFLEPKSGGDTLGMVMAWHPEGHPEREIGWVMFTDAAEGRGYAFEAAAAVRDHVFGRLGWETAVSYIDPDNARSIALAERLGALRDPDAVAPDEDPVVIFRHSAAAILP